MPQSKVVIVYSPNQALRRTVTIPDDDSQVPIHTRNLAPGEAVLVAPLGLYRLIGPDAILARVLRRQATSDRYAVTDGAGKVVAVLNLDHQIDRHLVGRIYHDPDGLAEVGGYVHVLGISHPSVKPVLTQKRG